jgi:hypothetical protein
MLCLCVGGCERERKRGRGREREIGRPHDAKTKDCTVKASTYRGLEVQNNLSKSGNVYIYIVFIPSHIKGLVKEMHLYFDTSDKSV